VRYPPAAAMPSTAAEMSRQASAARCEGISKRFAGELVLRQVDLDVPAGSFISLVGPSGCGKTTLLRIIAGLETPDQGAIKLSGPADREPRMGVVFQQGSLLPWKSVRRNIALGLELARTDRKTIDERVRRAMILVHLTDADGKKYPHQLSGGMQQRAGIARALALEPDILLMDEPFASVDAQTREDLHDELLAIWEGTGTTVLFVTHSIDEAIVLSDEVVVMGARPGRVVNRFRVALPRPRTEESARLEPEFAQLRQTIRQLLGSNGAPGTDETEAR
jgi:ABC-type nitrate/sulfonate/bicarbonate transport system ATPase subunit